MAEVSASMPTPAESIASTSPHTDTDDSQLPPATTTPAAPAPAPAWGSLVDKLRNIKLQAAAPTTTPTNDTTTDSTPKPKKKRNRKPKAIQHLVLDSGFFIAGSYNTIHELTNGNPDSNSNSNTNLQFYSLPDVHNELRDERSKQQYENFPFPIVEREVDDTAMKAVVRFAKLSGEFYQLSVTDLKVAALAYMLHVEQHGKDDLATEPKLFKNTQPKQQATSKPRQASHKPQTSTKSASHQHEATQSLDSSIEHKDESEQKQPPVETATIQPSLTATNQSVIVTKSRGPSGSKHAASVEDDDGEGEWISVDNLHSQIAKQSKNSSAQRAKQELARSAHAHSTVATITTDYTLQNLMLQMGLRLISINGLSVTSARHFVKKCHACNEVTQDMSKEFCPGCGLHTLIRVTATINGDGSLYVRDHWLRPINIRGTKYSIPKPKGGRKTNDLILAEDMMPTFRFKQKQKKQGTAGEDLFDVVSEHGSMLGNYTTSAMQQKFDNAQYGYGRNPNESRPGAGRRPMRNT